MAIADNFPVSDGHTLIIPRRHVATLFEATDEERLALFALVDEVKLNLDVSHAPDGYNIGINSGEAAGQTIDHLHIHVIPRYSGDVADPVGGVRGVVPGKANYKATEFEPAKARRNKNADSEKIPKAAKTGNGAQPSQISSVSALTEPLSSKPIPFSGKFRPHPIQQRALKALSDTRSKGNRAGLVVMATGLGKTWLAAFDSCSSQSFERVLFVAHREEILDQAMKTFQLIRPDATAGLYDGRDKFPNADLIFASVQTISRQQHLNAFDPNTFDYIVIDEFHHATARTYRKLLDHFTPNFQLGLTATPQRMDGGDLLSLCNGNLVFRCDVADGITSKLLCPFKYFGIADEVNYQEIPWRSSRFSANELTQAVATTKRASHVLEHYHQHAGERTLAFCCTQQHADFMNEFFNAAGIRSAVVHSGEGSAPRTESVEALRRGDIQVLFTVDMFNEGVDIPAIDTVLMLRPTESPIIWMQQLGRGLRVADGKSHLTVLDYIGNHRSFVLKSEALLLNLCELKSEYSGDQSLHDALKRLQSGELEMPPGCKINYDLQAIDLLKGQLKKPKRDDAIKIFYEDFKLQFGQRPTASETFHSGYNPRSVRKAYGSWFGFVQSMGDLTEHESDLLGAHENFLLEIEKTLLTKSFKMLTLLAILQEHQAIAPISIDRLTQRFRDLVTSNASFNGEVPAEILDDSIKLTIYVISNPVNAWIGGNVKSKKRDSFFEFSDGQFSPRFSVATEHESIFGELLRELVDWRIAEYLARAKPDAKDEFIGRIIQSNGRPIIKLPNRDKHPQVPTGEVPLTVAGKSYTAKFAKEFLNVIRDDRGINVLPALVTNLYGEKAGQPGTRFEVKFICNNEEWDMRKLEIKL